MSAEGYGIGAQQFDPRMLATSQAQQGVANITKAPRLEAAAGRLEHLADQLEKALHGAHSHLDRIIGPQPPRVLTGAGQAYSNGTDVPQQSQLHRLDQALDRLAAMSSTLAGGLLERLAGL